jgi:hypothetical protein
MLSDLLQGARRCNRSECAYAISEALPSPASVRKAEREIAEFRKFQQLSRSFLDVNEKICRLRPVEEEPLTEQEKKRRMPSNRKSRAK